MVNLIDVVPFLQKKELEILVALATSYYACLLPESHQIQKLVGFGSSQHCSSNVCIILQIPSKLQHDNWGVLNKLIFPTQVVPNKFSLSQLHFVTLALYTVHISLSL